VKGLNLFESVPVVTGDDVKNAKPAPDILLVAAEKLGVSVSDCIIVGDSPWDLLAGRRLKALGVGLLCGGYAQEELERAGAHLVYQDPTELLENLAEYRAVQIAPPSCSLGQSRGRKGGRWH
jgi:beta-phosphoglucomutase-like phosphatase (HAD superfamily)